jgi:hypothetical protein
MLAFITLDFVIPKANQMQRSLSKHLHDKWIFLYESEMLQNKKWTRPYKGGECNFIVRYWAQNYRQKIRLMVLREVKIRSQGSH